MCALWIVTRTMMKNRRLLGIQLRTALIGCVAFVAALLAWSFAANAEAQAVCSSSCTSFCRTLDYTAPERAPWHLERTRLVDSETCWCYCCDVTYTHSWQVTVPLQAEPTDTPPATRRPTRRPAPRATATAVPPTATRRPTRRPAPRATATAVPPTATAIPVTSRPTATSTPTSRPPGRTPAPPFPEPPAQPGAPTATPIRQAKRHWSPCLIQHAGTPLNLCPSASGSGWWLYYFGSGGRIETGPNIPRNGGSQDRVLLSSRSPTTQKPVVVLWVARSRTIRVITYYAWHWSAQHKPYIFDVLPDGSVVHWKW